MTFVILGDGEMQEGLVWESAMAAGHYKLDNLIAIIDRNRWQSCDSVVCTIDIDPLAEKLKSFNWDVIEIDGHDIEQILKSLSAKLYKKPLAIIANTIKGKGISFMEENNNWHQSSITKEQYNIASSELKKGKIYE
jgi:transketolase